MPVAALAGPLIGLGSSIIGGISSKGAANQLSQANKDAAAGVNNAVTSGTAGVNTAVGAGQAGVNQSLTDAQGRLTQAGTDATGTVNTATTGANNTLADTLKGIQGGTNAYTDAGSKAVTQLSNYASNAPKFSFNYDDYKNDPAYAFQLKQGQDAIQNSASARGTGVSGNALKDLTQFGQGLASTYYGDAFNRAKTQFDTNQNATLQNLTPLISAGLTGTGINSNAQLATGGQQAANTLGAGRYAGDTGLNIANTLSQMGLQGSEFNSQTGTQGAQFNANLGLTGANDAGKFLTGAGNAQAAGTLGVGNAITSGIGSGAALGQGIYDLFNKKPAGPVGGNAVPGMNDPFSDMLGGLK